MPLPSNSLVSLSNAGLKRNGQWLVRGIDMHVGPGEIVTLIGPNGSGKSTCAKMALGILKPDEGEAGRQPGLITGYVPQKLSIDWTLPVSVQRFMSLTGPIPQARIDEALEAAGAAHRKKAEMRTLSGGEFQRVLLARAMARKPSLMVLDEPVQGVDIAGEAAIYDLIRTIRDELGCGILLISHDLHIVMRDTDRVICLNGHICCQGAPKAVAASPHFKTLFGSRAAELAVYMHDHDHTHLPDGTIDHDASLENTPHAG